MDSILMLRSIYAVYDLVSLEIIGSLIMFPSDGAAVRFFSDGMRQQGSLLSSHPGDFNLVKVGELDTVSGEFQQECPHPFSDNRAIICRGVLFMEPDPRDGESGAPSVDGDLARARRAAGLEVVSSSDEVAIAG